MTYRMHASIHALGRVIKRGLRYSVFLYRQAANRFRALPHFIILGAQKSGTTSLFSYLSQHPQIFPSLTKEVHFFDGGLNPHVDNYVKGIRWYRAHFPYNSSLCNGCITGEASPLYLYNPLAPGRIFNLLPDVKLIAILRNPTERAISHYYHVKRLNMEPLPIMEAFQEEDSRLRPAMREMNYKSIEYMYYSYKMRGLYRQQIDRYLQHFDMNQLLILDSETFFSDPATTLKRVFDFLGVDGKFQVRDLKPKNVGSNKTKVSSRVYEYLNAYFSPHNEELYQLLGKALSW